MHNSAAEAGVPKNCLTRIFTGDRRRGICNRIVSAMAGGTLRGSFGVTGRHLSFPPFPWFGIRADHCALVGVDCRRRRSSGAIGFVGESAFRVPAMVSSAKISYLIPRE